MSVLLSLLLAVAVLASGSLAQSSQARPGEGRPAEGRPAAERPADTGAAVASIPEHVATRPVARDGWHLERHELLNTRVADGSETRLVFVGDSITQGWEAKGAGVWEQYYGDRHALNIGISGDRTEHVRWRLAHGTVEGLSPELVVVMIGTNNAAAGHTAEQIADGITAIVGDLRQRLPDAKILLLAVFPRGETAQDGLRNVNLDVNRRLAALHDERHVWLLDIGESFLEQDGTLSKEIMPDLLHLSERGYRIWAEAIEPSVRRLMNKS